MLKVRRLQPDPNTSTLTWGGRFKGPPSPQFFPMCFLPLVLIFLAALGGVFFPEGLARYWFVPFLTSAIFLGLPHGAADWGVLKPAIYKRGWRKACPVLLSYGCLLVAAGVITLTFLAIGLLLFLGVSAWHFGCADARDFATKFDHSVDDRRSLSVHSLLRGGLIVVSPFAFRIEDMFAACQRWCELLGSSWLSLETLPFLGTVARFLLFYILFAIVGLVLMQAARGLWRSAICLALETALLLALFGLLHPLFALGTYFLCWHSVRHLSHLREIEEASFGIGWLYRLSGPFLIPSLAVIAFFSFLTDNLYSPGNLTIILIIFFAVVTPAHQWLVDKELHSH